MSVVVDGLLQWYGPGVDDGVEMFLVLITVCYYGEEIMCMVASTFGAVLVCQSPVRECCFCVDESIGPFEGLILEGATVFPPVEGG